MARKRDDTVKLVLRLPPDLHRRLEREAAKRDRSLNTEMIERLTESFVTDLVRSGANRLLREGAVDQVLTEMIKKSLREIAVFLVNVTEAEATPREAEAKVRALTDIPFQRALTLIFDYIDSVGKKELPHPESFGPIIEMLIKDAGARGRKAEWVQEAEKAKTASSVLPLRLKQANREGQ